MNTLFRICEIELLKKKVYCKMVFYDIIIEYVDTYSYRSIRM